MIWDACDKIIFAHSTGFRFFVMMKQQKKIRRFFIMREKRIKISFTDFECNLLINGINEWRNMDYKITPMFPFKVSVF